MATSGNFTTNAYSNRSLSFNWSIASQSTVNNQTTIAWNLVGTGSASGWYESGNFQVKIDGNIVYSSATRIRLYNGTVVASGNYTFTHDSNGNKSFSASAQAGIYTIAVNVSGSGSWSLPQIARAATINTWGTNGVNKQVDIDGSSSVGYTSYSSSFYYRLRISIPNVVAIKHINNYQKDAAITFTSEEKATIYSHMTTSKTITLGAVIETYTNSSMTNKIGESTELMVTAYLESPEPTLSTVTYADTNASIVAITGSNQKIVRNKSTLVFTLNTIASKKQATLVSAKATINGVTKQISLSGTSVNSTTINFGVVNVSSNTNASIVVTDSRGYTVTKTVAIQVLNYAAPSANVLCQRRNNFYTETNLKVSASYSNLGGGNSLTIKYQYKKVTDANYGSLTTISNNTSYTLNLDNSYAWNIKVVLSDTIGSTTNIISTVERGIPIAFWDIDKSSMGVNCFPSADKILEVEGDIILNTKSITPKVLYNNASGTTGGVTLSETAANFSYMEIYYSLENTASPNETHFVNYKSVKVFSPNGKKVGLEGISFHALNNNLNIVQLDWVSVTISGTSLSRSTEIYMNLTEQNYPDYNTQTKIKIYRVVGYR